METSIPIDIDKVQRVLLTDGWHRVPGVAREGTGLSRARHIDLDVPKFAGAGAME